MLTKKVGINVLKNLLHFVWKIWSAKWHASPLREREEYRLQGLHSTRIRH